MAFIKYAHSKVVQPNVTFDGWEDVRAKEASFNARTAASKVVFKDYDPDEWLLSHCTIVASVDTEDGPGSLGKSIVDGFQIDRRFSNYLITPTTSKFVNNNHDAWDRPLLQQVYKTFVGGENYVEHLQIKEMSKGKVIDAAARDIGDSLYVDILVATQRKFRPLIAAITSGQLKTLSMGCFIPGTQVSMADGTRLPIEDVAPGDRVITHKGRVREVLNKQIRIGKWSMRRIDAVGLPSSITATDNHPLFVLRPRTHCACGCGQPLFHPETEASDRRMGKRFKVGHDKNIFNPNNTYSLDEARRRLALKADIKGYTIEEVRADELKVGDYLCFPRIGTEIDCPDDVTPGKARLLGLFIAEGSFLKWKGKPTEVQFNFSMEEKSTLVQETVDLLKIEFGVEAWVQDRAERTTCVVHAFGRDLADWFRHHGGEYCATKRLSPEAFAWPVEIQRHLVGGWLDGDGGRAVRKRARQLTGATTSYALACQMHAILARMGAFTRMSCIYGQETVEVKDAVNGGVSMRHPVTGKLAFFNLDIGARQLDALNDIGCRKSEGGRTDQQSHLRVIENVTMFPVTSIQSVDYEGPVHDMEVEEDHSYIVEGVAVHNCTVTFTQCTRCGNVAEDESQLCPHIRYFKGSKFYDDFGKERKVAELCGHKSDPGSVKFIEASWVANPAFTGAVLRNILSAEDARKMASILSNGLNANSQDVDPGMLQKVATLMQSGQFLKVRGLELGAALDNEESKTAQDPLDFGTPDLGVGGQGVDDKSTDKKDDPLEKVVNDIADAIRERALEKIRGEIGKGEAAKLPKPAGEIHENDSIIKSALRYAHWRGIARSVIAMTGDGAAAKKILLGLIMYRSGGWKSIQASRSFTGKEILAVSRVLDFATRRSSVADEGRIYSVVVAVGGLGHFRNVTAYLTACRQAMGRDLTKSESATLIAKGRLYALGTS